MVVAMPKWDALLAILSAHKVHDVGIHPDYEGPGARIYIHCWCNETLDDFDDYAMHIARLVYHAVGAVGDEQRAWVEP